MPEVERDDVLGSAMSLSAAVAVTRTRRLVGGPPEPTRNQTVRFGPLNTRHAPWLPISRKPAAISWAA